MARLRARVARAAALHQPAAATVAASGEILQGYAAASAAADHHAEQRAASRRLRSAAALLTPGWLGAPFDSMTAPPPLGDAAPGMFVRIGQAHALEDATFPVVVPLLRAGHIAIDADARDPRVAGLLRGLLLRSLAAAPAGSIQVRLVDSAEVCAVRAGFHTGAIPPAVTDQRGFRALLEEAERWASARPRDASAPAMLLVIASLPELTDGSDLARISALATAGPAGGLHIIAAGWPPPPLTAETTQRPLRYCTQIVLRNPHAWVGDPPGASFDPSGVGPGRLPAPVILDPDPPPALVTRVSEELAQRLLSAGADDQHLAAPPASAVDLTATASGDAAAWADYLTAARRLAASSRAATAVIAEHEAARSGALARLGAVRARVAAQAGRIVEAASGAGVPPPPLAPSPAQVASIRDHIAASRAAPPTAVLSTLTGAVAACDAAERALAGEEPLLPRPRRDLGIYTFFATLALVLQITLAVTVGRAVGAVALLGLPCGLAFSPLAFSLGWITIGALDGRRAKPRPTTGGVIVCLVAAAIFVAVALIAALA